MTNHLTQPFSKKLLFAMLCITLGSEVILYLSRFSYFLGTLYESIMVVSFFVGLKIHQRLRGPNRPSLCKLQWILQFTRVYLIFFVCSSLMDATTSFIFKDFNAGYEEDVEEYADYVSTFEEDLSAGEYQGEVHPFFERLDIVGYDFYSSTIAGLEEVYRLSYIILFLMIFKKIFKRKWEKGSRDLFLMIALFASSILFGVGHTLDAEYEWSYTIGSIVTFTNMGLLLGVLLLWSRNLWMLVAVHAIYDIVVTLGYYYFEYAPLLFAGVVVLVNLILQVVENQNSIVNSPVENKKLA